MANLDWAAGAETGGMQEVDSITGSPSAQATVVRTGSYSYLCGQNVSFDSPVASADTNKHIAGFAVRFADVSPATAFQFCRGLVSGTTQISLQIETNGDVTIRNAGGASAATGTAPFTVNTWHFVELAWDHSDTGAAKLWIDGAEVASVASADFSTGAGAPFYIFLGSSSASEDVYFDDLYTLSAATEADRFSNGAGAPYHQVFGYQNGNFTLSSSDSGLTPNDSTLAAGLWAAAAYTPEDTTATSPKYTANPADGAMRFDNAAANGRGPGPSGGAYTIDGTIKGARWIWRLFRGTGAGSTHSGYYGNGTDTPIQAQTFSLTTTVATYTKISVAANAVPLSTQVFAQGFGTSGAQDITCDEMWAMLSHVPPVVATEHYRAPAIVRQAAQRAAVR